MGKFRSYKYFLVLAMLSFSSSLWAQEDYKTVQKNDTLTSGEFHLAEQVMDFLTIEGQKFSVVTFPIGGYSEQTGLSVGLMPIFTWKNTKEKLGSTYNRPTSLIPSFEISTKGMYDADLSLILFGIGNWNLFMTGYLTYTPNTFYGINELDPVEISSYFNTIYGGNGEFTYGLDKNWFVGLRFDLQHNSFEKIQGDALNESVLGYQGGNTVGLGPVVKYDSRDDIVYPTKGFFGTVAFATYMQGMGNTYQYQHFYTDLRYFIPLANDKNVFAFNYLYHNKVGDVPFYALNQLGGKKRLRSIGQPNRFMDKQLMLLQAEYRREIWWRIGMTAFFGLGNTWGQEHTALTKDMKYGGGLGFRFRLSEEVKLNFRMDIGFGNYDQQGTWLTSREAY
ncbi:MAG: BamA/TamA family outer membrane protein [Flavobacteriaceae bacterium]